LSVPGNQKIADVRTYRPVIAKLEAHSPASAFPPGRECAATSPQTAAVVPILRPQSRKDSSSPSALLLPQRWKRLLRIRDLVEKPKPENAPSNLAITGRYVLPSAIFDCLERTKPGAGNEIQLTDAMRILAKEQGLWAYIYEGISYDAGDKLGFLKSHSGASPC